jgi:hypothetical protein
MPTLRTKIYTSGDTLPGGLLGESFFHSGQLFALFQQTPRHRPYLVTLETDDGRVEAQMLAVVRYRSSWLPPYYYMHCRIMGEGEYAPHQPPPTEGGLQHDDATPAGDTQPGSAPATGGDRSEAFGQMLHALTAKLGPRMLYVEVSHLSHKMFGYRHLRDNRYFPVRWMSIHNSLHSRTPEERISQQLQQRIDSAYQRGVVTDEVSSEVDFAAFMRLLRQHNWLKPKRFIPSEEFFRPYCGAWADTLEERPVKLNDNGRLFVTRYKGRIIGCSAVVYSARQAYLWFAAYRRKTYAMVHPRELTIWHAIKDAHSRGYEHIYFMDVGLPFRKNKFRDFILRFGGKPASTYRWFRCSIKWVNSLLSWIYRD